MIALSKKERNKYRPFYNDLLFIYLRLGPHHLTSLIKILWEALNETIIWR